MNTQQIFAGKNEKNAKGAIMNKTRGNKVVFAAVAIGAVIILAGLAIGGYFGWKIWEGTKSLSPGTKALEEIGGGAEKITESATKGVLPSIQTNPLENSPDINPADKANPFKDIKTNPFK